MWLQRVENLYRQKRQENVSTADYKFRRFAMRTLCPEFFDFGELMPGPKDNRYLLFVKNQIILSISGNRVDKILQKFIMELSHSNEEHVAFMKKVGIHNAKETNLDLIKKDQLGINWLRVSLWSVFLFSSKFGNLFQYFIYSFFFRFLYTTKYLKII